MSDRHSIVVYVRDGAVRRVAFCDCCPPVSVEVRTYETETLEAPVAAGPLEPMFPKPLSDGRWRDHEGAYRAVLYEPEHD